VKLPDWGTIIAVAAPLAAWLGYSGWKAKAKKLADKVVDAAVTAGRDLLRKIRGGSFAGHPVAWWEKRLEAELERRGINIDKLPAQLRAKAAAKVHDLVDDLEARHNRDGTLDKLRDVAVQFEVEVERWQKKQKGPAPKAGV
jgi:hypothetical protein